MQIYGFRLSHGMRRLGLPAVLLAALFAFPPVPGRADDGADGRVGPTVESRRAVDLGLAYLAANQQKDGSWTNPVGYKLNEDYVGGKDLPHVGVTSLACIALVITSFGTDSPEFRAERKACSVDTVIERSASRAKGW